MGQISIVVGDSSGDGHDKTETTIIECVLDIDELKDAFKKGTELIGFDLENCCTDYEDNDITEYIAEIKSLFNQSEKPMDYYGIEKSYKDSSKFIIYSGGFIEVWLRIVRLAIPEFTWEVVSPKQIEIGGYGLFE